MSGDGGGSCLGGGGGRVWGVSGRVWCLGRVWGVSGVPGGKARVFEKKPRHPSSLNPGASACDITASNTTARSRMGNL